MIEILLVGDMHLGRQPSRVPADLDSYGAGARALSPTDTWQKTVAWAVENKIDAVLLAGDVVESLEDRFEACGPLEDGVRTLADAGITVCAVAGNHDVHALPRLADRIEAFELLGRGGQWESREIRGRTGGVIDVVGWSFPTQQVPQSPLESFDFTRRPGVSTIGLLHGDLDASQSVYAPLKRRDLDATQLDAWFLGHIHKPSIVSAAEPTGYLGSLVGLDPKESGRHGPWHLRIGASGIEALHHVPLAPIRYERLDVDVSHLPELGPDTYADTLEIEIDRAIKALHANLQEDLGHLRAVGCRVRICGRSPVPRLVSRIQDAGILARIFQNDGVFYFLEKLIDETTTRRDLESLASTDDPPGLLARRLLALEKDGDEARSLVLAATPGLRDAAQTILPDDEITDSETIRETLLHAGYAALDALFEKKDSLDEATP